MNRFERLGKLGEGTYGVVYMAKDRSNGAIVALKKIRLEAEDEGVPATAIREISVLKELNHPNVIRLIDVLYQNSKLFMEFEYLEQDLHVYMRSVQQMEVLLAKSYMYQLLSGMAYCHSHRTLHRDLKPSNLLIDRKGALKIGDFGLARVFGLPIRTCTHEVVTLWYRAPEVLLGARQYGTPVDIWSCGCIMAEMVAEKCSPLFAGDSEIDQLFRIFRVLGTPTEETWPGVSALPDFQPSLPRWKPRPNALAELLPRLDAAGVDLLQRMLVYHPADRISAKQALLHPWFNELHTSRPRNATDRKSVV